MHRRDLSLTLVSLAVLVGCAISHRGGELDDGGGSASSCDRIAGYRVCPYDVCPDPCLDEGQCILSLGVCVPPSVPPGDPRIGSSCHLNSREDPRDTEMNWFCLSGDYCAVDREGGDPRSLSGPCVSAEMCDVADEDGLDARCMYSDRTPFVNGPPSVDECPPPPDPEGTFCGGPCEPCPWVSGIPFLPGNPTSYGAPRVSCVGVSETRGLGICAFDRFGECTEGDTLTARLCLEQLGRPCACMRLLTDVTPDVPIVRFVTFADSCRAYRAMFPEDVECMDPMTWEPLP
ncbi:hypothetical protein [Sandaracinus amylolyticus]|uniref:hypothetical protein n=1 Tax=Sandaracinus amylolyticus TaxID=927083 RepID=UPI001F29C32A|nr:hypothetical protein [Sandaracinus amylolyticus]UJR83714.1 Hypothetical protein I5071_57850 [Sandaracinus amylolyticus]